MTNTNTRRTVNLRRLLFDYFFGPLFLINIWIGTYGTWTDHSHKWIQPNYEFVPCPTSGYSSHFGIFDRNWCYFIISLKQTSTVTLWLLVLLFLLHSPSMQFSVGANMLILPSRRICTLLVASTTFLVAEYPLPSSPSLQLHIHLRSLTRFIRS